MLEMSFHIHRDEVTRTLIGCPPTAKNRIRSYCYGTAVTVQRQVESGNGNGATDFFHVSNVILTALT